MYTPMLAQFKKIKRIKLQVIHAGNDAQINTCEIKPAQRGIVSKSISDVLVHSD